MPHELPFDRAPYRYQRRVHWGDGDPASIVYTVRFLDYVMEALEGWWREVADVDWFVLNIDMHMGAPVVHLEMDFRAPVVPGDIVDVAVLVSAVGRSAITFDLQGSRAGTELFTARLIASVVDNRAVKAIEIPSDLREPIERYLLACREPQAIGEASAP